MDSFTLTSISSEVLQKMLNGLKSQGNQVSESALSGVKAGEDYNVSGQGIRARVVFYPESQIAVVQIIEKPWIVPASLIEHKVREALAVARSSGSGPTRAA